MLNIIRILLEKIILSFFFQASKVDSLTPAQLALSVGESLEVAQDAFREMDPLLYKELFIDKQLGPESLPNIISCLFNLVKVRYL